MIAGLTIIEFYILARGWSHGKISDCSTRKKNL